MRTIFRRRIRRISGNFKNFWHHPEKPSFDQSVSPAIPASTDDLLR